MKACCNYEYPPGSGLGCMKATKMEGPDGRPACRAHGGKPVRKAKPEPTNLADAQRAYNKACVAARGRSYAAEVIADYTGKWTGNGLRFATLAEATKYAKGLAWRWTAVREYRVVESSEPPNYTADEGATPHPIAGAGK